MDDLRDILDRGDLETLTSVLSRNPARAVDDIPPGPGHPLGAAPLAYVAMLRFDTSAGVWRDVTGTGALARALLAAGAPLNGEPDTSETPLMTAASYGDAEVAQVLVSAGADLEAVAPATSGGVPGGTALMHAAVFGMTGVVDVLVRAGAVPAHLPEAAAVGDLAGFDLASLGEEERVPALNMASDHQRIDVINQLVSAGTPLESVDAWGRHPLRLAAGNGRPLSLRHLLDLGADPNATDENGRTPLDLARAGHHDYPGSPGHPEVIAILEALKTTA